MDGINKDFSRLLNKYDSIKMNFFKQLLKLSLNSLCAEFYLFCGGDLLHYAFYKMFWHKTAENQCVHLHTHLSFGHLPSRINISDSNYVSVVKKSSFTCLLCHEKWCCIVSNLCLKSYRQ